MKYWLPLAAAVFAAYTLGHFAQSAWGGLFFLAQAGISLGLLCFITGLYSRLMPRLVKRSSIFIGYAELCAISLNMAALCDYYGWFGTSYAWYYDNYESCVMALVVFEVLALLIYPAMWAKNGGFTRLYRGIFSSVAGYFLGGYGYRLGVPNYQTSAKVQIMRGLRL